MTVHKPILVTGSPRSGTTWAGRMIAQASTVRYVHEPFNISSRSCTCGIKFDQWFYYISKENESKFYRHLEHTIGGPPSNRFNFLNLVHEIVTTRRLRRPIRDYIHSFRASRVLVKDPIAIFSTEWLASTFDMDVIIIIRHPAAVASSYKRLDWSHPFSHFLDQPLLMKEYLYPFEAEIRDFANNSYNIIDQAALLWKSIYSQVPKYQESHKDWLFVRYEDLAKNPVDSFQTIFKKLRLEYDEVITRTLQAHSTYINPANSSNPYLIKRNSEQTIWDWKKRLTPDEVKKIRARVEDVSGLFYSDEDW